MRRNEPIYSADQLMREKAARRKKTDPMMTMLGGKNKREEYTRVSPVRRDDTKKVEERRTSTGTKADTQVYIGNITVNQGQAPVSSTNTQTRVNRRPTSHERSVFIAKDNYAKEQNFMEDAIGIKGQIYSIDAAIEYAKGMPDTAEKTELLRTIKGILEQRKDRTEEEIEQIMSSMNKEKDR